LSTASSEELAGHLERTMAMVARLGDIHFHVVLPGYLPLGLFEEYFCELFPDRKPFDAYRLLQGFDNKTLETDRALFDLARRARLSAALLTLIQETPPAALRGALEQTADGRAFLADLNDYLHEYGQRGETWSIATPSWIEEPAPVFKTLRDYTRETAHDPHTEMRRLSTERDTAIAEARATLKGYPTPVIERFESLLESAQFGNILSEDHNFWIDFRGFHQVRRVIVACGERLAGTGATASADDIWHLTSADVLRALRSPAPRDLRPVVAAARGEVEHFGAITRPAALGSLPHGAPPDDPMTRMMNRFFGTPPAPAAETGLIRGNAGSPGKVTGRARVVVALADAAKLQPGEVLVAETTAPPWTPLFGTACAVVTDTGGILSHCAVVAREYGIPAVVGAVVATSRVRDGQLLEIDGDAGTIRLLD
jgi:pyruvate,water dikinase